MDLSNMNSMMVWFNIFIAVYLLYYAIKGSGKVYENDYPKEMKEEHAKFLRMFCWVTGVGMLVLSILEYISISNADAAAGSFNSPFTIVSIVYVLACIVVYFVVFQKKFRPYLKKDKTTPAKTKKK